MRHTRLWVTTTIIAGIILVWFLLSAPHTRDVIVPVAEQSAISIPSVTVHDSFKKGTHTITGSLVAPTACTSLTATATFDDSASSTNRIQIDIAMPKDTGVCLQQPSTLTFSTSIAAPVNMPMVILVNGAVATTTSP